MNLQKVRADVHNKLLLLRRIERILDDPDFEVVFNNKDEQQKIMLMIEQLDVIGLDKLLKGGVKRDLDVLSAEQLRIVASKLGISYYTKKHKAQLVEDIYQCLELLKLEKS